MQKTADIYRVARLLIEHGNASRFSRDNLPPYQAAIQEALPSATDSLVDEIGFVDDKDLRRLYLTQPIDFQWLDANVQLEPPLQASPEKNRVYGEWIEIVGGTVIPSASVPQTRGERAIRAVRRMVTPCLIVAAGHFYNVSAFGLCTGFGALAAISMILEFRLSRHRPGRSKAR